LEGQLQDFKMPSDIILEPNRFEAAANHYLTGRPAYANGLVFRIVKELGLSPNDPVMDLGSGPGQLAMMFAPFAGSVLAVDPSPHMLAIGKEAARHLPNVRFKSGSSFDIGPDLGWFKFVTIGRAFHWMNRSDTLKRLDGMVVSGGAVALFSDSHPKHHANLWVEPFKQILEEYAAGDIGRTRRRSASWASNEEVLLASPFSRLERWSVIETRTLPAAQLTDRALSMSSISRARIGNRLDLLLDAIEQLSSRWSDGGTLTEVIETSALIARRPN
jgi:SAM-dependent methyltransferase